MGLGQFSPHILSLEEQANAVRAYKGVRIGHQQGQGGQRPCCHHIISLGGQILDPGILYPDGHGHAVRGGAQDCAFLPGGFVQGHGQIGRWLLVAFGLAVVVGLAWWIRNAERLWSAVAIGLIMGGAVGNNLIDRVRLGMVADFLDFSGLGFKWVFNVADAAINVGIAVLLIDIFLSTRQPVAPPDAAKSP